MQTRNVEILNRYHRRTEVWKSMDNHVAISFNRTICLKLFRKITAESELRECFQCMLKTMSVYNNKLASITIWRKWKGLLFDWFIYLVSIKYILNTEEYHFYKKSENELILIVTAIKWTYRYI